MTPTFIDNVPIPLLFAATVALLLLAYELGYRWGLRGLKRKEQVEPHVGTVVGAMLALLAFVLGFVFAMASARFDERKHLVLDAANTIATTWRRAQTLPSPYPERIGPLLEAYLNVQLEFAPRKGEGDLQAVARRAIEQSEELHIEIWRQAVLVARENPDSEIVSLFLSSLNEMIDLNQSRLTVARDFRVPSSVWRSLYVIAVLTLVITGYQAGHSATRHTVAATVALLLTLSVVLVLNIDLDRPVQRFFRVNEQAMRDVRDAIDAYQASVERPGPGERAP